MSEQPDRYPCRVLILTNEQTAESERQIREHMTGEQWERYLCVDLHWHVQPVAAEAPQ
jgi:hypothetical protein